MSAVKDVQHSLNVIRQLSTDENAAVQTQILELMLQASISQLKSISTETQSKDTAPSKPTQLPIPKPAKPTAPSPKTKPKPQPSLNTRLNRLRAIKPQAPTS
jgi:cell division septation protein DedD